MIAATPSVVPIKAMHRPASPQASSSSTSIIEMPVLSEMALAMKSSE
jgi:hypothetical protein